MNQNFQKTLDYWSKNGISSMDTGVLEPTRYRHVANRYLSVYLRVDQKGVPKALYAIRRLKLAWLLARWAWDPEKGLEGYAVS